ncbi:MAG: phosphatase PAP2 family protein [Rhodothermales bacterium]
MLFPFLFLNPGRASAPLVVLLCWMVAPPLYGQSVGEPAGTAASLDERVLFGVYNIESPVFQGAMRSADASAYPIFLGAPFITWGSAWLLRGNGDFTDAYRLTLSQAATTGIVVGLKRLVRRPRPYAALSGITARTSDATLGDSFSMPSGHASTAFTLATSWSLSHDQWYVVVPSFVWAGSVALSRLWLGVHYPSDVLAGSLLGAAVGVGVHLLSPQITPGFLEKDEPERALPMLHLRFALP